MKKQYYFEDEDAEVCHQLDHWEEHMRTEGLTEIEVMKAVPDKIPGIFWCRHVEFCGEDSSDTCGNQCNGYKPRNGKSGCCKHYTTQIYTHGEKIVLKLS